MVDADRHGLPSNHGFVVETADHGQVWLAWRRTPGGALLGTGGAEHRSRYYFPTGRPADRMAGRVTGVGGRCARGLASRLEQKRRHPAVIT
jgi:hypothetical protein